MKKTKFINISNPLNAIKIVPLEALFRCKDLKLGRLEVRL